jgi:serine/threonine-protein kinase
MSRGSGPHGPLGTDPRERIPAPGEVIASKYEVERVLGAGGMGVVIAARHIQLGQKVAIKFMRGQAATDSAAVGRFQREARAAAALMSEHVAKVFDVGTLENGAPYIVLEYLAGVDLAEVLRRNGPLSIHDALGAVLQACEALAEAHAIGIVHRDLKPSNLFYTRRKDGTPLVKVLDFGISKSAPLNTASPEEGLTASGHIMGSPGYMSPEQVRSAKAVDARSDIWSLGVILYELLTGVSPFAGETIGDTFARIVSETPPPVHERRPDIPARLSAVIARCLERDPNRRIQTVAELASKLAPFAPPEASLSVERILRLSGSSGDTVGPSKTVGTPSTMSAIEPYGATPPEGRGETGPAWLRSQSREVRSFRGSRPRMLAIAAAGMVTLAALGVYTLRGTDKRAEREAPSTMERRATAALPPAAAPPVESPTSPAYDAGALAAPAVVLQDLPSPTAEASTSVPRRSTLPLDRSGAHRAGPPGRNAAPPAAPSGLANDPSIDGLLERRQ